MGLRLGSWSRTNRNLRRNRLRKSTSTGPSRYQAVAIESLEVRFMLSGDDPLNTELNTSATIPRILAEAMGDFVDSHYFAVDSKIWRPTVSAEAAGLDLSLDSSAWFLVSQTESIDDSQWAVPFSSAGPEPDSIPASGSWTQVDETQSTFENLSLRFYRSVTVDQSVTGDPSGSAPYTQAVHFQSVAFVFVGEPTAAELPIYDPLSYRSFISVALDHWFTYSLGAGESARAVTVATAYSGSLTASWNETYTVTQVSSPTSSSGDPTGADPWDEVQWIDGEFQQGDHRTTIKNYFVTAAIAGNGVQSYDGWATNPDDTTAPMPYTQGGSSETSSLLDNQTNVAILAVQGDLAGGHSRESSTEIQELFHLSNASETSYDGSGTWHRLSGISAPTLERDGINWGVTFGSYSFVDRPKIHIESGERRSSPAASLDPDPEPSEGDPATGDGESELPPPPADSSMLEYREQTTIEIDIAPIADGHGDYATEFGEQYAVGFQDGHYLGTGVSSHLDTTGSRFDLTLDHSLWQRTRQSVQSASTHVHQTVEGGSRSRSIPQFVVMEFPNEENELIWNISVTSEISLPDGNTNEYIIDGASNDVHMETSTRLASASVASVRNGASDELPESVVAYMQGYDVLADSAAESESEPLPLFDNLAISYLFAASDLTLDSAETGGAVFASSLIYAEQGMSELSSQHSILGEYTRSEEASSAVDVIVTIWNYGAADGEIRRMGEQIDSSDSRSGTFSSSGWMWANATGLPEIPDRFDLFRDEVPEGFGDNPIEGSDPENPEPAVDYGGFSNSGGTETILNSSSTVASEFSQLAHYRTESEGSLRETQFSDSYSFAETTNAGGDSNFDISANFETGDFTVANKGSSNAYWSIGGSGERSTELTVIGTGEGEVGVLGLATGSSSTHLIDRANLASDGDGQATSSTNMTTRVQELEGKNLPAIPGPPADPSQDNSYSFDSDTARTTLSGESSSQVAEKYNFREISPFFDLEIRNEMVRSGLPVITNYRRTSDDGHEGPRSEHENTVTRHISPKSDGLYVTLDGYDRTTVYTNDHYEIPDQVLDQRGIPQSPLGQVKLEIVGDESRESLTAQTVYQTTYAEFGNKFTFTQIPAETTGGEPGTGETSTEFESEYAFAVSGTGSITELVHDSGTYQLHLKTLETRSVENSNVSSLGKTTTTGDIDQTFDVTQSETISFNPEYEPSASSGDPGDPLSENQWYSKAETTWTAESGKNVTKINVDSQREYETKYAPRGNGEWLVTEVKQADISVHSESELKYSAGGTMGATFDRAGDPLTAYGSIAQTVDVDEESTRTAIVIHTITSVRNVSYGEPGPDPLPPTQGQAATSSGPSGHGTETRESSFRSVATSEDLFQGAKTLTTTPHVTETPTANGGVDRVLNYTDEVTAPPVETSGDRTISTSHSVVQTLTLTPWEGGEAQTTVATLYDSSTSDSDSYEEQTGSLEYNGEFGYDSADIYAAAPATPVVEGQEAFTTSAAISNPDDASNPDAPAFLKEEEPPQGEQTSQQVPVQMPPPPRLQVLNEKAWMRFRNFGNLELEGVTDETLLAAIKRAIERVTLDQIPFVNPNEAIPQIDLLKGDRGGVITPAELARLNIRANLKALKGAIVKKIAEMLNRFPAKIAGIDAESNQPATSTTHLTADEIASIANRLADAYIRAVDRFLADHPGARPRLGARNSYGSTEEEELALAKTHPWCADWARTIGETMTQVITDDEVLRKLFRARPVQWKGWVRQHNWVAIYLQSYGCTEITGDALSSSPVLFFDPWFDLLPRAYWANEHNNYPLTDWFPR